MFLTTELLMKQHYFIKFDPRVKRLTGCDRATLILEKIEYFFSKQPNGFYKFIEPCSHRLYRKFDSWSEELGCDRKSFTRAWEKIAFRHKSRRAFNEATDKFEGKIYASFYDRNRNQMFFIRNHELANETLKEFYKPKKSKNKKEDTQAKKTTDSLASEPLRNGHNGRSYKDVKMTPSELFKNNSHAEEIIKKMIEIWTVLVEEGRGLVKLSKSTVPFLKKAFTDKFDNCLEKWKKYCYDIASSRFLMGEKNSFKAKLDWALLFKNIEKVLDGQYGIGDRTPKAILASQSDLLDKIISSSEAQGVKDFRTLCLNTVGSEKYVSLFQNLGVEFRDEGEIILTAEHRFGADFLEQTCYSYLRVILQELEAHITKISIFAPGETRGRLIERERGGAALPGFLAAPTVEDLNSEEISPERELEEDKTLPPEVSLKDMLQGTGIFPGYESIREDADFLLNMVESKEEGAASKNRQIPTVSLETKELRAKLRKTIPPKEFPGWLGNIEVEGVGKDGTVVALLEDDLAVGWCRSRFGKEVFEAAASLWSGVNKLIICKREAHMAPLAIEKLPEKSENGAKQPTFEQAIESFLSVVTRPLTRSPGKIMGTPGMQGACQAFG